MAVEELCIVVVAFQFQWGPHQFVWMIYLTNVPLPLCHDTLPAIQSLDMRARRHTMKLRIHTSSPTYASTYAERSVKGEGRRRIRSSMCLLRVG